MRELNIRNITLIALISSCFMQIGGQFFALSVVVRKISEAPPRSFAILEGHTRMTAAASGAPFRLSPPGYSLLR